MKKVVNFHCNVASSHADDDFPPRRAEGIYIPVSALPILWALSHKSSSKTAQVEGLRGWVIVLLACQNAVKCASDQHRQ